MRETALVSVKATLRTRIPTLPFQKIAIAILGTRYTLSILLSGDKRARALNQALRKKNYTPNVLSYRLNEDSGEIILNVRQAEREALTRALNIRDYMAYLFIHACLHLKGEVHGSTMDKAERKWCKHFNLSSLP